MSGIGGGEHRGPRSDTLLRHTMMHVGGRQQPEAGVVVLGVVLGEEDVQCARASWIDPNRVGNNASVMEQTQTGPKCWKRKLPCFVSLWCSVLGDLGYRGDVEDYSHGEKGLPAEWPN